MRILQLIKEMAILVFEIVVPIAVICFCVKFVFKCVR